MRGLWILPLLVGVSCTVHQVLLEEQAPPTLREEPGGYEEAVVTRVIDGDTIEVQITGRVAGPGAGDAGIGSTPSVRLIGIDTPESVTPGSPVECFGREASAATTALVDGARVLLVKDVEETDRYDRLLRYVYIGEEMANARLIVNGYAHAYTYPPNVRHSDLLVRLQRRARIAERGLWSHDACGAETAGRLARAGPVYVLSRRSIRR
jgi:endonuclease YncB( thermonuclease family)